MQKRARILDPKNMKRLHITRRGRSDISQSNPPSMICVKMVCAWFAMVALDTLTGFRFELLWPTWMMTRAAFDSISMRNQHCVTTIANPTAAKFTVIFVCVTATSDLICYLFIPIRMLIFLATTYVWLNLYCHAQGGFIRTAATLYGGERSQSWSILSMSIVIIACELFLRIRITKFDYVHFVKSHPILISVLPNVFSVTDWAGVPPVWPLSLNAFFGAHSIGYPVVLITVSLHYYFNEWKLRRKQNDVANRNEQLFRILVESLPAEYEGPKDYSSPSQSLEDDVYYLDPPLQPLQAIQSAPAAATPPTKKNGVSKSMTSSKSHKKKNGSTPPNDSGKAGKKSTKSMRSEELEEMDDSDAEDYWRDSSDGERRGGGIWIIRMFCDAATWAFYMLFARSQSTTPLENASRRGAADEDDDDDFLADNDFEKRNGRTDSLNLTTTKSRTNTMSSVTSNSASSRQNNNNQKQQHQKANGRSQQNHNQNHNHQPKTNGHARNAVRDSSHDTNASNDHNERHLSRELDTLRTELASRKSMEEDYKLQVSMHESNESRLSQQVSNLKLKVDQVEMKCSSLERHRESDKAQLEAAERKYAELLGKKVEIEATLSAERKARNESAGKKFDTAEHLRGRERQLETEIDKLRADLKSKEEANMKMERELNGLRSYKEDNDIESMKKQLETMKSKALQMEESLTGENKLKQSLFKCLGESRNENKIKDQEIAELKSKLKGLQKNEPMVNGHHSAEANNENDTTASDQSSPHQHSAMGSPVPSTKMPLSVNVCNRGGSPYNEKMSPIASMTVGGGPPPPDYMMAVSSPVEVPKNAIRYNEFMHMPTGEHRLFDQQPTIAPTMSPTPDDEIVEKGTFGAVSKPVTRMA